MVAMVAHHDHNPISDFSTDDFLQALKLMAARRRQLQGKKKEKLFAIL